MLAGHCSSTNGLKAKPTFCSGALWCVSNDKSLTQISVSTNDVEKCTESYVPATACSGNAWKMRGRGNFSATQKVFRTE